MKRRGACAATSAGRAAGGATFVTRNGPEPLDNITADLDREHYVQRQVRPVAEPVLDTFGLSFEQAIGDDRQMELF